MILMAPEQDMLYALVRLRQTRTLSREYHLLESVMEYLSVAIDALAVSTSKSVPLEQLQAALPGAQSRRVHLPLHAKLM